jgi:GT2 family glycosyltransferase
MAEVPPLASSCLKPYAAECFEWREVHVLLGRMYRIFQRYADIHVTFDLPGGELRDVHGRNLGTVDAVQVRASRLRLSGHAQAYTVTVAIHRTTQRVIPAPDLARNNRATFDFDVPLETGPVKVTLEAEGGSVTQVFAGVTEPRLRRARAVLAVRFLWTVLCLLPEIYVWKWRGDLGAREVVKQRLGLVPQSNANGLTEDLFAPQPAPSPASMATLVMPVFNAFEMLPEALSRIETHSGTGWRLVVVEDCSSDPQVRPFLQAWAADPDRAQHVQLLCNEKNLGFVGSVNRALVAARHWPSDPVVLLNSDVFVPQGWLGRMLAPLTDPSVASVTPMSNDAEIFTVPVICRRGDLQAGAVDRLDAVAATFNSDSAQAEAPTGVGFCMAMAPQFLAQVPQFDTIFGRGYGEETDWCQKARALGGRHLGVGNVFVEHRGGVSFGSVAKQRLLEKNLSVITRRYPRYDAQVQDFIRHDPLATARLALGLVWVGSQRSSSDKPGQDQSADVPVYLGHSMGGGAEMYLQRRIAQDLTAGGAAVVLRVGQVQRWQIELHTAFGVTQGILEDTDAMVSLIALLPDRRIVYSCGVGDRDPLTLPDVLVRLAGGGTHPVELLVHDYFPISPAYTLLGQDGRYRGVPVAGTSVGQDPAHHPVRPNGLPVASLTEWQDAWGRLIDICDQVTVFCETGRALMVQVYPQCRDICRVAPHALLQVPEQISPPAVGNDGPVIGVLGNIGVPKGAAVVQKLSADLARTKSGRIVVVGYIDPDFAVTAPSRVHGGYELRDLAGLVARYGISCWLIPSIWPETFSFTTHEALATGLPVFAFDLGAQGAAVAQAVASGAAGGVLPLPGPKGIDAVGLVVGLSRLEAVS